MKVFNKIYEFLRHLSLFPTSRMLRLTLWLPCGTTKLFALKCTKQHGFKSHRGAATKFFKFDKGMLQNFTCVNFFFSLILFVASTVR